MKNDVLIQAISEYKRKKFVEDMGCSKIFVDSICIGVRQLGVIGEPSHYIATAIQPWQIIDAYDLDFYEGNALKYLLREKGDRKQDLLKAIHYLEKMVGDLDDG